MRLSAKKSLLLAVGLIIACAGNVCAEKMKIVRKNGLSLHGEVTQKGDYYEITTTAGLILIPAAEVSSVEKYIPFAQEYARRQTQIEAKDTEARFRLAKWCHSQNKLTEAKDQLNKLLKIAPDHEKAKKLLVKLSKQASKTQNQPSGLAGTISKNIKLASQADIQTIRRAELRGDDNVRIVFRNNVLKRFVDYMLESDKYNEDDARRFYKDLRPVQKAIEMIDSLPARDDIHSDILIDTNPRSLETFKTRVWPIIANNCASAQCHGGPGGSGKLKLINTNSGSDEVFYTNLLILASYHNIDGWLIDRNRPKRSLLLEYMSPQEKAEKNHPGGKVDSLKNTTEADFTLIEAWINQLMIPPDGYKLAENPKSEESANTPAAKSIKTAPKPK